MWPSECKISLQKFLSVLVSRADLLPVFFLKRPNHSPAQVGSGFVFLLRPDLSPRRHANSLIVLFILPLTIPVGLFALRVELISSVLAFPLVLNGS